jgi:hypothetical protein
MLNYGGCERVTGRCGTGKIADKVSAACASF